MDPSFSQYSEVFTYLVNMVIYLEIPASQNPGTDLGVSIQPLPIFIVEETVSEKPSDLPKFTQLETKITRTRALWFFLFHYLYIERTEVLLWCSLHPLLTLLPKPQ